MSQVDSSSSDSSSWISAAFAQTLTSSQALHSLMSTLKDSGTPGSGMFFTLDDRFVGLDTTHDIVGLDRQDLLQGVSRAVRLERPDLHLAETLSAELRLAAKRLLRHQRVRAGRRAWILSSTRWCSFRIYM